MPVFIDILENQVLGREYLRGERNLLRLMIEKRFGTLPEWASQRLAQLTERSRPAPTRSLEPGRVIRPAKQLT